MKRLAALLLSTSALAACGGTVDRAADEPPARRAAPLPSQAQSRGLEAADGRSSYALVDGKLRRLSTRTGRVTTVLRPGATWEVTSVSATGAWVALRRGASVLVVDVQRQATAHRLTLPRAFRVEAISAAGDFLFLEQRFVDGSYAVRGFDLAAGQLVPGTLGRKGETVRMQGDAGQVVASPDGRWLLTVYVETTANTAFVHALNLIDRLAICIPLPPCVRCGADDWTLDLAADNRTLHAVNAAGRRATIDLERGRVV
jgi:hypothetical protein